MYIVVISMMHVSKDAVILPNKSASLLAEAEPRSVSSVLLLSAEVGLLSAWDLPTVERYLRIGSLGNGSLLSFLSSPLCSLSSAQSRKNPCEYSFQFSYKLFLIYIRMYACIAMYVILIDMAMYISTQLYKLATYIKTKEFSS